MAAGIFRHMDVVIIRVKDVAKSREWYEEKFGFKVSSADEAEQLVVFDMGRPTPLCLWQLKPGESLPSKESAGTFPIFFADDLDGTYELLRKRGVEVEDTIHRDQELDWFMFYDPDGNRLEAVHY